MISLGLDCGTQSTKCIALDAESGEVLASSQKSYGMIPGLPDGSMEQDPGEWLLAADAVISKVLQELGERKNEVVSLGVSGQQHGLVVMDEKGEVIRPAKLWCDTSTVSECAILTEALGGTSGAIEETGNAVLPGYTAPKILWIKNHESENYSKIRSILLPHDYLNFWLSGEKRMEYGDASGTALLQVAERVWSKKMLAAIGPEVEGWLPPLGSSNVAAGNVRASLLEKWGLKNPVVVSAGGGDNMMGAIGTGNVFPGAVTVSLGTSGTLYAFSASPVIDPKGEVAAFCDSSDNWLPLACTMNVTLVTELTAKLFGWDHKELDQAVSGIAPGSDGLLLLPYLLGERTPNLPGATGVWSGWNAANFTAPHMARSAMEGVTLGLAYGLQRFRLLGIEPTEIRLTGGGSNSRTWRQICSDVFGVPTVCLKNTEGAALGAAIQALWVKSRENGSDAALVDLTERLVCCDESTRSLPTAENTAVYEDCIERASRMREALISSSLL